MRERESELSLGSSFHVCDADSRLDKAESTEWFCQLDVSSLLTALVFVGVTDTIMSV